MVIPNLYNLDEHLTNYIISPGMNANHAHLFRNHINDLNYRLQNVMLNLLFKYKK